MPVAGHSRMVATIYVSRIATESETATNGRAVQLRAVATGVSCDGHGLPANRVTEASRGGGVASLGRCRACEFSEVITSAHGTMRKRAVVPSGCCRWAASAVQHRTSRRRGPFTGFDSWPIH